MNPGRPRTVRIKEEDAKESAALAMTDVLGWYGYDNQDTAATLESAMGSRIPRISVSCSPTSSASPSRCKSLDPSWNSKKTGKGLVGQHVGIEKCASCGVGGATLRADSTASTSGAVFCSDNCLVLGRRAALKRTKVCDWCKHVRHTVCYVDFYDGDHQLQFCSDKCLNQYKMHLFCKEATAHLHLKTQNMIHPASSRSNNLLITPDLWLKNYQETPNSPSGDIPDDSFDSYSSSPSPQDLTVKKTVSTTPPLASPPPCAPKRKSSEPPKAREPPKGRKSRNKSQDLLPQPSLSQSEVELMSIEPESTAELSTEEQNRPVPMIDPWKAHFPYNLLMTPYPIFIPLPIPIPIPIPLHVYAECSKNSKDS